MRGITLSQLSLSLTYFKNKVSLIFGYNDTLTTETIIDLEDETGEFLTAEGTK